MANRISQVESDKKLFENKVIQDCKVMHTSISMYSEKMAVVD